MFAAIVLLSIYVLSSSAATTTTTTIESVDNEMQPIIDKLATRTRFTKELLRQISAVFKSKYPDGITAKFVANEFITAPIIDYNARLGAMKRFVNLMDTDNDGSISFEEFIDFESIWMHGNDRQKYESMFRLIDANRNGYITEAELFAFMKVDAEMTPSARPISISQLRTQIRDKIKQYDVDSDGNVSLMEYIDKKEHATDSAEVLKDLENDAKEILNRFSPVVRYMY